MTGEQTAINGYSVMWLYVMFDLPTETKLQRKHAAAFRKDLLSDGFTMHQFSVYIRHCASYEAVDVHVNRVRMMVPDEGVVSIVKVTDKQFGDTIQFVGRKTRVPEKAPVQLEFL